MVGCLAGRRNAIVAGAAGSQYLRVVDLNRWHPRGLAVTVFADVRRLDVCRRFASCLGTVVAAEAVVGYSDVIEYCGNPCRRIVAAVALVAGRDMRRGLACRLRTVVATDTAASDRRVVHKGDHGPVGRNVAVRALAGRHDMIRRFCR